VVHLFGRGLSGENIPKKALEKCDIVKNEFGHVHISEGPHKQEFLEKLFFFRGKHLIRLALLSLGVTSSSQH
jgi:hypothetical protein